MRDINRGSYQKGCMYPKHCASTLYNYTTKFLDMYIEFWWTKTAHHQNIVLELLSFFIHNFHWGRQQTEWKSPFLFHLLLPCWECRCKSNHIFLPSLSFSKNRKHKKNIMIFRKPLVKALAGAHHNGEESQLILLVLDHVFILGTSIPVFFS